MNGIGVCPLLSAKFKVKRLKRNGFAVVEQAEHVENLRLNSNLPYRAVGFPEVLPAGRFFANVGWILSLDFG